MTRSVGAVVLITVTAMVGVTTARARTMPTSPLDGRWTFTWTRAEVAGLGGVPAGRFVVEFRDGHFARLLPRPVRRGARFTTSGNVATLVFPKPAPPGTVAGRTYTMRWSIYRDRLTWSKVPGRASLDLFFVTPWIRVR